MDVRWLVYEYIDKKMCMPTPLTSQSIDYSLSVLGVKTKNNEWVRKINELPHSLSSAENT